MKVMNIAPGRTDKLGELALELPLSVRESIDACLDCHQACAQLIPYCLERKGEYAEVAHIRLLQDCSQICAVAANFMMRESGFHARLAALCADVCKATANECERFTDDEVVLACVQICRKCAESCANGSRRH